jgi:hypothetical protein
MLYENKVTFKKEEGFGVVWYGMVWFIFFFFFLGTSLTP